MVRGQLYEMHSGGGSPFSKNSSSFQKSQTRMSDSTPVKNKLIPAVAQMMSAWLVNDGCDFVKLVKWCLIPCVLPHGSDVFVDVRFLTSQDGRAIALVSEMLVSFRSYW